MTIFPSDLDAELREGRLSRRSFCFLGAGVLASGAVSPWALVEPTDEFVRIQYRIGQVFPKKYARHFKEGELITLKFLKAAQEQAELGRSLGLVIPGSL